MATLSIDIPDRNLEELAESLGRGPGDTTDALVYVKRIVKSQLRAMIVNERVRKRGAAQEDGDIGI